MSTHGTLQLATRGSALARWQAETVKDQLASRRQPVELVTVETEGDQVRDELIHQLGTTGAFVRSLDEEVLAGELNAAVHSMKDMPTDQPDDLVVAGVLERGPPGDVLVTRDGTALEDLPEGATIGTSSLRRGAQLLARRPDLDIAGLRGNVDTRVEKLLAPPLNSEHERRVEAWRREMDDEESEDPHTEFECPPEEWVDGLTELEQAALDREAGTEYDAICLAEAGLARSGLLDELHYERLDPTSFVPAPAQGVIAVTALDDEATEYINDTVDHPPTRVETTVERTVLAELGGGCVAPVGIYARLQGDMVSTRVRVLSQDGTEEVSDARDLPVERHAQAAAEFAADLADRGAADLIEEARREDPDDAKRGE
ncbi:hydroxymethylbilane synthase [Halovenus salina]|uniref:hydroxymethylbilane synthase n=1 Tax=Halovenus salina TaxID=1510225 RepID=UPI002260BF96|nr:hydroxymethylbilane synthase [Halovenus salina]